MRLLRQPSEASGPGFEGYILSQVHFVSNLAQFTGILGPEIPTSWHHGRSRNAKPQSCPEADFSCGKCRFGRGQASCQGHPRPLNRIERASPAAKMILIRVNRTESFSSIRKSIWGTVVLSGAC